MSQQTTYHIQPEVLAFMRKSSGMTEDDVAKKLKLSKSKYLSIETGKEKIPQTYLIQLADIYKRPLIAFYSPDLTTAPDLPHDYRLNRDKKLSSEVFFAKRKALYLSEQLKEITGQTTTLPQINRNASPSELAKSIKALLKIDYNALKELTDEPIISYYKSLIEEKFFIPVLEHALKTNGVRAFSVYGEVSVIVLNESDIAEVKLFSLFHELCHLLKREEGICSIDIEKDTQNQPEERYCDEFAAHILMPETELRRAVQQPITTFQQVEKLAKSFGRKQTSNYYSLKELEIIDTTKYRLFKSKFEAAKQTWFRQTKLERTFIKPDKPFSAE
ncbi:MAG: ImmA/IrrE family metallo-endopeptidase [Segetibacter sp.]